MNYTEYRTEIKDVAEGIIEECLNHGQELSSMIHETIDGHQWIIYTRYHDEILRYSENAEAYEDIFTDEQIGERVAEGGLAAAIAEKAFYAMDQDVRDAISELSFEDFECTEEEFNAVMEN